MRVAARFAVSVIVVGSLAGPLFADVASPIDVNLDSRTLEEVLSRARSRNERGLAETHARYRIEIGGPKLDRVEIITEYRRALLLAQSRIAQGDFTWTVSDLEEALQPFRGRVVVVAAVRLPPLNVYARVPEYVGQLTRDSAPSIKSDGVRPTNVDVQPVYPPGLAAPGSPIQGARVELTFSVASLDPTGRYFLVVAEEQDALDPVMLDFARYR